MWVPWCEPDCSVPLRFSNNSVCTSNVTSCHISQQFMSLLVIILLTIEDRYKLWSYSSWSFPHFPITFRSKSLNTLISTIPIFSLQYFLKVTHQVSYICNYKKYYVNMHTLISQKSRFKTESKIIGICSMHYSKFISSTFLDSAIFTSYYPHVPKYFRSSPPFQNVQHWIS